MFIDEMPWLDTPRSNFVSALEGFWNGWASARKDILLIVCGSAASWISKKLFRNRGGLHNRVTCRICLNPFTLNECEGFVRERGLVMSRSEIAECYMAFGGIPYYWRYLDKRFSVAQNLDRMFFEDGAPLADEFVELYSSLFRNSAMPRKIVKELAGRVAGMTRKDIAHALGISASGKLTDALEGLTVSGFVRKYNPFGSGISKQVFQLVDAFSLFHFRYLAGRRSSDGNFWLRTVDSPSHRVWCGLAFERLCLLHQPQIRRALGIVGVLVECCAWHHRADDMCPDGAQIDLLFDRADNVINICECKYTAEPFRIDKEGKILYAVNGSNDYSEAIKASVAVQNNKVSKAADIKAHISEIDAEIEAHSNGWKVKRIGKSELAMMYFPILLLESQYVSCIAYNQLFEILNVGSYIRVCYGLNCNTLVFQLFRL